MDPHLGAALNLVGSPLNRRGTREKLPGHRGGLVLVLVLGEGGGREETDTLAQGGGRRQVQGHGVQGRRTPCRESRQSGRAGVRGGKAVGAKEGKARPVTLPLPPECEEGWGGSGGFIPRTSLGQGKGREGAQDTGVSPVCQAVGRIRVHGGWRPEVGVR